MEKIREITKGKDEAADMVACTQNIDPVCCGDVEFDNDCLAKADGFTVETDCVSGKCAVASGGHDYGKKDYYKKKGQQKSDYYKNKYKYDDKKKYRAEGVDVNEDEINEAIERIREKKEDDDFNVINSGKKDDYKKDDYKKKYDDKDDYKKKYDDKKDDYDKKKDDYKKKYDKKKDDYK